MDTSRNDQLGELASQAALERSDFLASAAAQLRRFLDTSGSRISMAWCSSTTKPTISRSPRT